MDMSFDTLLIGLYCIIDHWLKADGQRFIRPQGGRKPDFSDAELLTLIIAHQLAYAQWQERHWLRWLNKNGYRAWFPNLPTQSAYNRRARNCWAVVNALRIYLAQQLVADLPPEAVTDSTPIQVRHWRRFGRRHLALPEAELGYCAAKREYFYGYRLLVLVSRQGVVIDWVLLPGTADERDGLEALLHDEEQWYIWGDKGFLDAARQERLAAEQGIEVVTPKRANQAAQLPEAVRKELAKVRPIVETTFAQAKEYIGLERPRAKTLWGVAARLNAKLAALAVIAWANIRRGVSPLSYVNFAW
jgi:Transposase DDE domain